MSRSDDTIASLLTARVIRQWLARRIEHALSRGDRETAQRWGEALDAFDRATLGAGGTKCTKH